MDDFKPFHHNRRLENIPSPYCQWQGNDGIFEFQAVNSIVKPSNDTRRHMFSIIQQRLHHFL